MAFNLKDIGSYWEQLYRILNPKVKANPALVDYATDFGIHMRKIGFKKGGLFTAPAINTKFISRLSDNSYTTVSTIPGDREMAISLDFNKKTFKQLLKVLPEEQAQMIRSALSRQPFYIQLSENDSDIKFGVISTISNGIQRNAEENYIPFTVKEVMEYNHLIDKLEDLYED